VKLLEELWERAGRAVMTTWFAGWMVFWLLVLFGLIHLHL
jgi:hypothetical protein